MIWWAAVLSPHFVELSKYLFCFWSPSLSFLLVVEGLSWKGKRERGTGQWAWDTLSYPFCSALIEPSVLVDWKTVWRKGVMQQRERERGQRGDSFSCRTLNQILNRAARSWHSKYFQSFLCCYFFTFIFTWLYIQYVIHVFYHLQHKKKTADTWWHQ